MNRHLARRHLAIAAAIVTMTAAAGCGGTPGSSPDSGGATPSGAVKTTGFDKLGPVTLTIWSYDNQNPGLEPVHQAALGELREEVPEREDQADLQGLQRLVNVVNRGARVGQRARHHRGQPGLPDRRAAGEGQADPPARPVRQGVRLGQVVLRPSTWQMFQWTPDGKTFGAGPEVGRRPDRPERRPLRQHEEARGSSASTPRSPTTSPTSTRRSPTCAAKLPKSEPVIELGNKEGYGTIHFLGGIQGAYGTAQADPRLDLPRAGRRPSTRRRTSRRSTKMPVWAKAGFFNTTTTRSSTTTPRRSSPRARASSRWAATGRPRSSRPASAPTPRHQHAARPERQARRRSARPPGRGTSRPRRSTRTSRRRGSTTSSARPTAQGLMYKQQQIPAVAGGRAAGGRPVPRPGRRRRSSRSSRTTA